MKKQIHPRLFGGGSKVVESVSVHINQTNSSLSFPSLSNSKVHSKFVANIVISLSVQRICDIVSLLTADPIATAGQQNFCVNSSQP
jgi:hypothetical protein